MKMDWGTAAQWVAVILSLAALAIAWVNRRSDKITAIEQRQDRHDARLQKVEADMSHLPDTTLVHGLQLSMVKMEGQMAVIIERVGPIKAIAERLQESMLEGNRK
jgi:hypothetical protein